MAVEPSMAVDHLSSAGTFWQVDQLREVSDEQLDTALSVGTDVLWLQGAIGKLTSTASGHPLTSTGHMK